MKTPFSLSISDVLNSDVLRKRKKIKKTHRARQVHDPNLGFKDLGLDVSTFKSLPSRSTPSRSRTPSISPQASVVSLTTEVKDKHMSQIHDSLVTAKAFMDDSVLAGTKAAEQMKAA